MMRRIFAGALAAVLLAVSSVVAAEPIRLKDLGKIAGWRENGLTGYGLVTGLAGTGDSSRNKATRQSIANMLSRFDMTVVADDVQSRNVAAVMVTANLSPFARAGDTLDATVTSIGDARSLVGGTLIVAPLKAANGAIYALAQGALSVGGYKYDMNGNVQQKNHPTVASIPNGATVEQGIENDVSRGGRSVTFVLSEPDHTTASRAAAAINQRLGDGLAQATDASGIEIHVPEERRARLNDFLSAVENVLVEPDQRARVVINERTGTVVAGGNVRLSRVAISHGELKVSIETEYSVSQPLIIGRTGGGVQSIEVANSQVDVKEGRETGLVTSNGTTVADLVQSLVRIKTSTRDIISILRAVKAAGALHAELVVQ